MANNTTASVWIGKTGYWSEPTNWSGSVAPGAGYTISIADVAGDNTITFDLSSSPTYGALTFSSGVAGIDTLLIGVDPSNTPYTLSVGNITLYQGAIELAGGVLLGSSGVAISAGASVYGYGTLNVNAGLTGAGTLEASGPGGASSGVLDVTGTINSSVNVVVDSAHASDLKIETNSSIGNSVLMDNSNQTIEIGAKASVKFVISGGNSWDISGGTIIIDGGYFQNGKNVTLDKGANLLGAGTVQSYYGLTPTFSGSGTVTAEGGTLTFNETVDPTGTTGNYFVIDNSATLAFRNSVGSASVDPTVDFNVSGSGQGYLNLINTPHNSFYATVTNFVNHDEIYVGGSSSQNTLSVSGNDVVVMDGATIIQTINMGSSTAANDVGFLSNTQRTTLVTSALCFMAGTMIRTPEGEVAVETLKRGDLVLTSDGAAQPVCWLGRQTVSTRFADPLRTWPIRIKAGALADNVPFRDLVLSPDHAVLVDGALIHAGALVNDASIVRETAVPEIFTYYHVELDDHSLVLAENTPAETFVDNVERLAFDNWAEHEALYPEGKTITELPYPRAKGRRQVPVYVRVQLAERAEIIGASTSGVMVA